MGVPTFTLTDEQREWLCRWFPVTENSRLAHASGMGLSTLHRFARSLGLTKSRKGMKAIRRRVAAYTKKLCEKNGYYDSLRGRTPHPNSAEGTRRMWQEIREGKREHPFAIMKRKRPRSYRKYMQRKSESRRELIRRDTIRLKWGLPQRTRLRNVVMQPYTRSQTSHRYYAQKRGYILADDHSEGSGTRFMIFYDDETNRAPIFERNLIKDGFRIERWTE